MSLIWQHIQANLGAYIALLVCLAPVVFFTRKYSVPFLLLVVEFVIYVVCMHLFIHGAVAFGSWYKSESTFRVLADGTKTAGPGWTTPLDLFWQRDLYSPAWLFYVEVALVIITVGLMLRFRPLTTQRRPVKKPAPKRAAAYGRSAAGSYGNPAARPRR